MTLPNPERMRGIVMAALFCALGIGAAACGSASRQWIVTVDNGTDHAVVIQLDIDGMTHTWTSPPASLSRLIQRDAPADLADLRIYQPGTCTIASEGHLPPVSTVVSIVPGLPTASEPFSRFVRVQVGATERLDDAASEDLPEGGGCDDPSSSFVPVVP